MNKVSRGLYIIGQNPYGKERAFETFPYDFGSYIKRIQELVTQYGPASSVCPVGGPRTTIQNSCADPEAWQG
jgi:hypothetical protein